MIEYREPKEMELHKGIPDVFTFLDGSTVENPTDWDRRAKEIRQLYAYYMYGPLPNMSKEKVSYSLGDCQERKELLMMPDQSEISVEVKVVPLRIKITNQGRKSSFDAYVCLPADLPKEKRYPVYMEMTFVWPGRTLDVSYNAYYAASRGYASICYNPCDVAADNSTRTGTFYDVYPYGEKWEEQTGVLAAWGWGASKILDVLEDGLAMELELSATNTILAGVSRYGKATLLAGACDKRIKVVVPACSGAGGAAMYRYKSEGRTYDFATLGLMNEDGSTTHYTTQNEALGNLQSNNLKHWFNDRFLEFECVEQFPFDQHHLAALVADEDRYLFFISGMLGEDWVNPAAASLTYAATRKVYEFLGITEQVCLCEHLNGHAVLLSDMVKLLDFCDVKLFDQPKEEVSTDFATIYQSVFWEEGNLDEEAFTPFLEEKTSEE